ncbi:MAG TPA: MBL fold metallo-hydrolase [Anaeromyxobacteraceae bacterium]|nr:MBL fold metallo-hydrolase [Anaeromyxobacteraceae bacterium]
MRFFGQALVGLLLAAVVGAGGGAVYLASRRGTVTRPLLVEPGLVAEKGAGAFLYAIRTAGGAVLVDAGADAKGRPIDAALRALGATRVEVTDLLLTHGHTDHTAGAAAVPNARVHAGQGDVGMAATADGERRGLAPLLARLWPHGAPRIDDAIAGERRIALGGGEEARALPVPGHSRGSTAYLVHGVLFVGDVVSYEEGRLVEAPRLLSDDPDRNLRSVAALAEELSGVPVRRVCAGHGGCSPDGSARELLARFAAGAR